MAGERRPLVARWAVVGLLLGLAAGLVVAVPRGGDALVEPLAVPLAAAAAGGLLGALAGLVQRALRGSGRCPEARDSTRPARRRRPRGASAHRRAPAADPAPAGPEAPAVPEGLPAPEAAEDNRPAPEGWYTDPLEPAARRWWDGEGWTAHVWRPRRRLPR